MDIKSVRDWWKEVCTATGLTPDEAATLVQTVDDLIAEVERLTALCDGYRGEIEGLKESLQKVQNIAKAQVDRHIAALNIAREAGRKEAGWCYEESAKAIKAEKEGRAQDNADLTAQVMAAEAKCEELQSALTRARAEIDTLKRLESMVCPDCHGVGERTVSYGQTPESYHEETVECGCITEIKDRARAEGMEEAAKEVDGLKSVLEDLSLHSPIAVEDNAYARAAYEAGLIAASIREAPPRGKAMRVDKPRFRAAMGLPCADCPCTGASGLVMPSLVDTCIEWQKSQGGCPSNMRDYRELCRLAEQAEKGE